MRRSSKLPRVDVGLVLLLAIICLMGVLFLSLRTPSAAQNNPGQPERTDTVLSTRTPLPNSGVSISQPREVVPGGGITATYALAPDRTALDGDIFATTIEVPGGHALVLVELQTGQMQRIAFWEDDLVNMDVYLSGRYVAWQARVSKQDPLYRLHVYDRELQREVLTREGYAKDMSAKDGLLVWRDFDASGEQATLVGYDLQSQTQFTITTPTTVMIADPRICSREWIIYLYDVHYGPGVEPGWTAIRARNLETGEELALTERAYLAGTTAGKQHDCDGQWATWFEASDLTHGTFNQHVYDLAARASRALDLPLAPSPGLAQVSGSIVLNEETGYDLITQCSFSLPYGSRYRLVISHDQILWWSDPRVGGPLLRLNVASVQRGP